MWPHKPNLLLALAYLVGGLLLAAVFLRVCYPDAALGIWETLSGAEVVVLVGLLLAGIIVVSLLASFLTALMQILMAVLQVAVLLGLVCGGVYLFQQYRQPKRTEPDIFLPSHFSTLKQSDPPPPSPSPLPPTSPKKSRQAWWEQNPYE